MPVLIEPQAFDPQQAISDYEHKLGCQGQYGATASFVGTMRDFNNGERVHRMTLEHYPGMTERTVEQIVATAKRRWEVLEILVVHRVGDIAVGEPIVLVAVWSAHRAAAFDACRFVMEELKSNAPFWKREITDNGSRWVEKNTPD